jgi:hypothetical protein
MANQLTTSLHRLGLERTRTTTNPRTRIIRGIRNDGQMDS